MTGACPKFPTMFHVYMFQSLKFIISVTERFDMFSMPCFKRFFSYTIIKCCFSSSRLMGYTQSIFLFGWWGQDICVAHFLQNPQMTYTCSFFTFISTENL